MSTATVRTAQRIQQNWQRVVEQVDEATRHAGRHSGSVQIVGVSKYVDAALTAQLARAGCQTLGENRPQALWEKWQWFETHACQDHPDEFLATPRWHMIGHLQRNKVRRTLPGITLLESLDSLRLAAVVEAEAERIDRRLPVLIEVNVTEDTRKTGASPDALPGILEAVLACPHLHVRGLMAMSTHHAGASDVRSEFAQVRQLRDRMQQRFGSTLQLDELSMGMSDDFPQAIAEGATTVRIGSSLWQGILV